jgi:hypothetical protein
MKKVTPYLTCLQKNQRGVVAFTVIENWGTFDALAATGWKLESIPPAKGSHGAVNDDCVTVWFLGKKVKETVSPGAALILEGL